MSAQAERGVSLDVGQPLCCCAGDRTTGARRRGGAADPAAGRHAAGLATGDPDDELDDRAIRPVAARSPGLYPAALLVPASARRDGLVGVRDGVAVDQAHLRALRASHGRARPLAVRSPTFVEEQARSEGRTRDHRGMRARAPIAPRHPAGRACARSPCPSAPSPQ